jgi:ribonucleoside-diphosphate reductase alpha chain
MTATNAAINIVEDGVEDRAGTRKGEAEGSRFGSVAALGDLRHPVAAEDTRSSSACRFKRLFTKAGHDVYAMLEWNRRTAVITDDAGKPIFEQHEIEAPVSWSDLALNIVASKYFRGAPGTPQRENSVRTLIFRVANTIATWGRRNGTFHSEEDAKTFEDELTWLLLFQHASFNSPVWFNVGTEPRPQCSACFINAVEDSMESILGLTRTEGMLFKYGSGSGTNFSTLRSSRERVKGGGIASGPVSFMKGLDAFAGVIKSGGKTRRAAKMAILDVGHPDILDFIECKRREEAKAHALIDSGYDGAVNGEAYSSIFFQNANNSVRVSDRFMEEYLSDGAHVTRAVTTGEIVETLPAREVMQKLAAATHACGDPGIQFDDTINRWHTAKASGRINASNPCSEYMFLDDTACNLASVNLMRFHRPGAGRTGASVLGGDRMSQIAEDEFDLEGFRHACEIMITAQEIIVGESSYPTEAITANSQRYRPLGLGYANLGALLMHLGLPYDSHEGRAFCGAITAILTGAAYLQSARLAAHLGPFDAWPENRESMLGVLRLHRDAIDRIDVSIDGESPEWRIAALTRLIAAARTVWDEVLVAGERHGFRNAQATVLAPTGTIAFMMDCDTTGIEPEIALIKYKRLSGGGTLKIVNQSVRPALERLGYAETAIKTILAHVDEHETIEGASYLKSEDLGVFDCAFRPKAGHRSIGPMGHVRMMAAAQPFLSGAISKTVNMGHETSIEEVEEVFVTSWKMGLKAIAVYRDGCKRSQPLSTAGKKTPAAATATAVAPALSKPFRRRLPAERHSISHRFEIQGHEAYITVGKYEDGAPGEIFLKMSKEGSTFSGLTDTIATLTSIALQYGVPLSALVRKFSHVRFEPSGFTNNPRIPMAKSVVDYCFRWLASKFLSEEERRAVGILERATPAAIAPATTDAPEPATAVAPEPASPGGAFQNLADAPLCSFCGSIMVRNGSCYLCSTCGTSNGCS